ncbi:medium chain dehydrogenase/reductase family protein [Jannaschia aquimarina]|uniref:QorA_2 protein n=1 Tax=Jannaschia aquimarina TaxID=935700 RepID=A0A0D1D4P0_9RHOB|nr:medium chain dehydrogenase/reductase family protein [Jannaschia aquimarina]KIT15043.1 Quinone oxidoreductase 1 [Jannaschia aquimarina]SNS62643.1 NADPH:quinone reductase [Jannaschia aquimarina]
MAMLRVRSGGRCVELTGIGAPDDALRVVNRPVPEPAAGEIVVDVEAAGVAFADVKMRHGIYPGAPSFPFVPGYDFAGIVRAAGADVTGFAVGDPVAGLSSVGSYAQTIALDPRYVARRPPGTDPAAAAAIVLNYVTALQMLERVAKVREGQTILVHGGGGGVGTALLDLTRSMGLRAFATASAGKHDLVRRYGGLPIDYRTDDFVAVLRDHGGADAVFDHLGGDHVLRSRSAAKRKGCVVGYGFAAAVGGADERAAVRRTLAAFARMWVTPGPRARFYAIMTPPFSLRRHIAGDLRILLDKLARGAITPHVGLKLPLEAAAEAHERLEAGTVSGKIVLTPGGDPKPGRP